MHERASQLGIWRLKMSRARISRKLGRRSADKSPMNNVARRAVALAALSFTFGIALSVFFSFFF